MACRDKSEAIPHHEQEASEFTLTQAGLQARVHPFPQARMATRPALDIEKRGSLTQTQLSHNLCVPVSIFFGWEGGVGGGGKGGGAWEEEVWGSTLSCPALSLECMPWRSA